MNRWRVGLRLAVDVEASSEARSHLRSLGGGGTAEGQLGAGIVL